MLPFSAPPGTTPRDYLLRVVPEAHHALVPASASAGAKRDVWDVSIAMLGERPVRYSVDGSKLSVSEGHGDAHLVLTLEKPHVERFLADWSGPRRWVPQFEPRGAALITDPRVLSRLAMVTGSMAATVPDFEGGPIRLSIAAFGGKRGEFDPRDDEADVSVEVPARTFQELLAGRLLPDAALSSGGVALRGKKLVAMQLAFAMAPFFPPPKV